MCFLAAFGFNRVYVFLQLCTHTHPLHTYNTPDTIDSPRVVLVVFLGGATHAEINALRFLQSQPGYPYRFVVVTTRMLSGNSLMDGFALQASKYTPEG